MVARAGLGGARAGDGRVLLAGGTGASGALASAEWFDPAAGAFTPATFSLHKARTGLRLMPLGDGRFLAAGGTAASGPVAELEVCDGNTCDVVGRLGTARTDLTATLLDSGKVLLAGGTAMAGGSAGLGTMEVLTPSDVVGGRGFHAIGSMATRRHQQVATRLQDGRILVTGGYLELPINTVLRSAEIFDPQTCTFTVTGSMTITRVHHTATLLPNGRVLVAGGTSQDQLNRLDTAELFDPATGAFTALAHPLTSVRESHTATLLNDGRVLLACGVPTAGLGYSITAETFAPDTGLFTATGSLAAGQGRRDHTATLMGDGRVLIVGGYQGGTAPVQTVYAFNPGTNTFSAMPSLPILGRMNHTAGLASDGRVMVAGGRNVWGGDPLATTLCFDPATDTFSAGPSLTVPRVDATATTLLDGGVLLSGGLGAGLWQSSIETYTPAGGWFWSGDMGGSRSYHTATTLANGRVLFAGGTVGNSYSLSTALLWY